MIKPDLIIFDCDGVLVDSEVLSCRCLSEVLARSGIEIGVDQVLDLFLGRSVAVVLEHYRESGLLNPEQFSAELTAKVRAAFRSGLGPVAGVGAVLERLRIPTCVASSSDFDRVTLSLSLTGLEFSFRRTALYVADGETRQARARPFSLRSRTDAGRSRSHPGDRGQRERRQRRQGRRHDRVGIYRRQPLSIARRPNSPVQCRGGSCV